jgi:Skp family chaperone for outer membrane proteins
MGTGRTSRQSRPDNCPAPETETQEEAEERQRNYEQQRKEYEQEQERKAEERKQESAHLSALDSGVDSRLYAGHEGL